MTSTFQADVEATVLAVLRDLTGRADLCCDATTELAGIPDWDSIAQIEAIVVVEEHFNVTLHTRDLDRLVTFGDFVAAVSRARSS